MYEELFAQAGLSTDEAAVYGQLLKHGPQGVAVLSKRVKKVKRSLLYKVLDRLIERGLVQAQKKEGATTFAPQSPELLLKGLENREFELAKSKQALTAAMPELKAKFNLSSERPVLRFFEGVEGLRELYEDKLTSGVKELYFVRSSRAEVYQEAFGKWFTHYLQRQSALDIKVYSLTVDDEEANHDPAIDKARNVIRTWIRPEDYTAPIEIDSYGDKTAIISFGKEIFGIMIESAPIACAVKELFLLADKGARTTKILHDHPEPKKIDVKRRRREMMKKKADTAE